MAAIVTFCRDPPGEEIGFAMKILESKTWRIFSKVQICPSQGYMDTIVVAVVGHGDMGMV